MRKVILDSNFLMIPFQFRVDIFSEMDRVLGEGFEPILLSPVLRELQRLTSSRSPSLRRLAGAALDLCSRVRLVEVETHPRESVDDCIVRVALEDSCMVATADGGLRKRLRVKNIPVLYLRQKSRLEAEGV